MSDLEQ